MAKILKGKPLPHILIPDTSILWHEDKAHPVNPTFDAFWDEHERLVELELVIPEVVRGELFFQQVTSAIKHLNKVSEHFDSISAITAGKHRARLTEERIRHQVESKIDKWIQSRHATVVPIPIARINWEEVCQNAIWRRPPFCFDPKDAKNEKGFRDTLIFETVAYFVTTDTRAVNIAFVCNDSLLRDTSAKRLKGDTRFSCYENLSEFSSYIKLTREQLTNEFIRSIIKRARAKFFKRGDPFCLWTRDGIWAKVTEQFAEKFDLTSNPPVAPLFTSWKVIGQQRIHLPAPKFQHISGERTYHWIQPIHYFRLYQQEASGILGAAAILGGSTALAPEKQVLVIKFNVQWKANVKDDARFHDIELENLQFEGREFRSPLPAESVLLEEEQPPQPTKPSAPNETTQP